MFSRNLENVVGPRKLSDEKWEFLVISRFLLQKIGANAVQYFSPKLSGRTDKGRFLVFKITLERRNDTMK